MSCVLRWYTDWVCDLSWYNDLSLRGLASWEDKFELARCWETFGKQYACMYSKFSRMMEPSCVCIRIWVLHDWHLYIHNTFVCLKLCTRRINVFCCMACDVCKLNTFFLMKCVYQLKKKKNLVVVCLRESWCGRVDTGHHCVKFNVRVKHILLAFSTFHILRWVMNVVIKSIYTFKIAYFCLD